MINRLERPLRSTIGSRLALLFALTATLPHLASQLLAGPDAADPWRGWLLTIVFGLLGYALGHSLDRRSTIALRRLRRAVRRLGRGDFEVGALDAIENGEWGRLAVEIAQASANLEGFRLEFVEHVARKEDELERVRAELNKLGKENMRLQCDSMQHDKSLSSLQEFVVAINQMGDPAQIAGQLLTYLDHEIEYSIATVLLMDPEVQRLVPVAISNREKATRLVGKYIKDIESLQRLGTKSIVGRVMESGKPLLIDDVQGDRRGLLSRPETKAEWAVPLKVKDKAIGVLHLESSNPQAYSREQERTLALLANATATAIGNARLHEEEAKVRMLREMDRVKSQLISTVSHELRTPLASIKGYSTSLQRPHDRLDERTRREFLQVIEEEADRLSEMIENLLDMSKIEAGVLRLHKQPMLLERIVRKVIERAKRRAPQFQFRVRLAKGFPTVAAAPHRVEQILYNLVENAIKYSPQGGRILILGEVEDGRVVLSVSDEGIGIPSEHHTRIFEPFYQVDSGTTRRVGGSGLGLAICRGFVEAHGGEIWVDSTPGQGSTFRFSLPLDGERAPAVVEEKAMAVAGQGG